MPAQSHFIDLIFQKQDQLTPFSSPQYSTVKNGLLPDLSTIQRHLPHFLLFSTPAGCSVATTVCRFRCPYWGWFFLDLTCQPPNFFYGTIEYFLTLPDSERERPWRAVILGLNGFLSVGLLGQPFPADRVVF